MYNKEKQQKNKNPLYLIYNISKYGFSGSKNSNTTLPEVEFSNISDKKVCTSHSKCDILAPGECGAGLSAFRRA